MLIQFAVENVLSFREETVLSMRAVAGVDHPEEQVVQIPGVGGVLRTVAIYGANASGKSNLVMAHRSLARLALSGTRPNKPIPLRPFKPGGAGRPSRWSYILFTEGRRVHYGLVATENRIEQEWLLYEDERGEVPFFQREGSEIEYGPAAPSHLERRRFLEFVAEGTRPEQPLLAEFGERNVAEVDPVRRWFGSHALVAGDILLDKGAGEAVPLLLLGSSGFREYVLDLLRRTGTGIDEIRVDYEREEIRTAIEAGVSLDNSDEIRDWLRQGMVRVWYVSRANSEREALFGWGEISDGTRRLLELSVFWFARHGEGRQTLLIDELDRSLHTSLAQYLVETFHETAPEHSQLIFTTHDTNLLDAGLLGRDAIWFVEKDPATGGSRLYSLADFDAAQLDQLTGNVEQGYLQGRFGAIPFVGDPARLTWST